MWWFDYFSHYRVGFSLKDYHTHARGTHTAARETPTVPRVVAPTSRKNLSPGRVPAKGAKGRGLSELMMDLGGRGAKRTDD